MPITPKVSVIMCAYNAQNNIAEALKSILCQTLTDFEFIVVNDGSTDKTKDILESIKDERVRVIHQHHLGTTKSLNKALSLARSAYIARQDPHAISFPYRLEKQYAYFEKRCELGFLGSRVIGVDDNGENKGELPVPLGKNNVKEYLLVGDPFVYSSIMFRKSLAEKVGFYNKDLEGVHDYDFPLKIAEVADVDNYPEVLQKVQITGHDSIKDSSQHKGLMQRVRKNYLKIKVQKGLLNAEVLCDVVRKYPKDPMLAHYYFKKYERNDKTTQIQDITYLQLRYLHAKEKWRYLKSLTELYIKEGRKGLAFMCVVESLRGNPYQDEMLKFAASLTKFSKPRFPNNLPEDQCAVSIIMRTFDRTNEIKESIKSVLKQTYDDYELIIINDSGKEEIGEVAESFGSDKIRYYRIPENKGLSGAFNEGILRARGKYIAYLDDDDVYYPNHLETLVTFLENNPECDCVYSNSWWCYGDIIEGNFVERYRKKLEGRPERYDRALLARRNYITTLGLMYRKSCINKVGFFNEDLPRMEDWEHLLRFVSDFKFCQVNEMTGEYRWTSNNSSNNQLDMHFLSRLIRFYYHYSYSNIVLFKIALRNNDSNAATEAFQSIINNYNKYSEKPSIVKDLFFGCSLLRAAVDRSFLVQITKDYMRHDPIGCVRKLIRDQAFCRLIITVPVLIKRLVSKLRRSREAV